MQRILYIVTILMLFAANTYAQKYPERSEVRKGNRKFEKAEYPQSIEHYRKALTFAPGCFEAGVNLGNALYKSESYDKSEETLKAVAADSLLAADLRAEAFYNLGNAQFKQEKYQEALESYKNSLRMNPSDAEAKYNYAYTKWLLKKNEQQKDRNKDDKDKDKDQNKDQNQDQDKDKGDQNKDQKDKDGQQDEKKEGDGQPQKPQPGISPQEQERMLDAIQAQEDKTQDKLKEKEGVIIHGGKNW